MASNEIWVAGQAYHSSLILPTVTVAKQAPGLRDLFSERQGLRPWLSFGWGDVDYYGASDKTLGKAVRALCWPTPSVMEVCHLESVVAAGTWRIDCSQAKIHLPVLLQCIVDSFYRRDPLQHPSSQLTLLRTEAGGCFYYRARGRYHMWNNCNNWTLRVLARSGLPVTHRTGFFAHSVKWRVARAVKSVGT